MENDNSNLLRHTKLLTEQASIVARLGEITSLLTSEDLSLTHTKSIPKQSFPKDFDRKAYAIGLIWRNPAISTRELARKVGVNHSTLFLPSWSDVAAVLRARKNLALDKPRSYHLDDDLEDSDELDH